MCRVNYSPDLWARLVTAASIPDASDPRYIPDVDLNGLLEDAYALAEAEAIDITTFLDLAAVLPARAASREAMVHSWTSAETHLSALYSALEDGECKAAMLDYVSNDVLGAFVEARDLDLQVRRWTVHLPFHIGIAPGPALSVQPSVLASTHQCSLRGRWPGARGEV